MKEGGEERRGELRYQELRCPQPKEPYGAEVIVVVVLKNNSDLGDT